MILTPPQPKRRLNVGEILDDMTLQTAPPPVRLALEAGHFGLKAFAPPIPEAPLAATIAPAVGSSWSGAKDLQEGKYFGAVANAGLTAVDVLSGGAATQGARTAAAVSRSLAGKAMTDPNIRSAARAAAGVVGRAWEAHHTVPLNGVRMPENWRNHPALIKVLPTETHRRLHGAYGGKPRFDPVTRAWYGTTDWMKAGASETAATAGRIADAFLDRSQPPPPKTSR